MVQRWISSIVCYAIIMSIYRTVQKTRQPTQPGHHARVRPVGTWSDDSGCRMLVLAKLTRPHAGRLLVFGFQTRDTRPEPNPYPFRWNITIFRPDPARSHRFPTKYRPNLNGSGQISARSWQIRLDFGQISPDPSRFRPDLDRFGQISSLVISLIPTWINPKLTRPELKNPTRSPSWFRVNFLFTRPSRVESRLGINPTRGHPYINDSLRVSFVDEDLDKLHTLVLSSCASLAKGERQTAYMTGYCPFYEMA